MQFGKLLGWGIGIYAVMYLTVAALAIYQLSPGLLARFFALLVLVVVASIAGLSLRRRSLRDMLPYAIVWTLEVALLDGLMSAPYAGFRLYTDWNVWVGYALVFFVPLFTCYARRHPAARRDI